MDSKRCSTCGEVKQIAEFTRRLERKSGYVSACKSCCNKRGKKWYSENKEARQKTIHKWAIKNRDRRAKQAREYRKNNMARFNRALRKYRLMHPLAMRAVDKVKYAVKTGKLIKPKECSICGDSTQRIHGHHEDYSKPLDVIWLCQPCHYKAHGKLQEG